MTPNDLLNHYKTKAEIARACGIHPVSVGQWFDTGVVPALRQFQIEEATGGKLKRTVAPKLTRVGAGDTMPHTETHQETA